MGVKNHINANRRGVQQLCQQQLAVPVHAACLTEIKVFIDRTLAVAQEWTALAKMVFRLKPLQRNNPPTNRIRLSCYRAVHTKVCTLLPSSASRCSLQTQMHSCESEVRQK